MKTNRAIVHSLFSVPQCWLYKDKQYFYIEYGQLGDKLPTISKMYESILVENGIPFRNLTNEILTYWSPECYEEIPITLPVYIHFEGGFRRVKSYTGNVITTDTQEKAFAVQDEIVLPAIDAFKEKQREEQLQKQNQERLEFLVSVLDGRPAVGFYDYSTLPIWGDTLTYNGKQVTFIPVYMLSTWSCQRILTNHYVAFDMDKLPSDGILELPVPAEKEGMFIGRDGWQVKEWRETLGLKRINVVADK